MDNETIRNLAADQLTAIYQLALNEEDYELAEQLDIMRSSLRDDVPVVLKSESDSYDEDDYGYDFQLPADVQAGVDAGIFNQEETAIPDAFVGILEDGNYVGELDEATEKVVSSLQEQNTIRDEETGEELFAMPVEEVPTVDILFTRKDHEELTDDDVFSRILTNHQAGAMLDAFGENYELVEDAETDANQKILRFTIDQNDSTSRGVAQALQHSNIMHFRGSIVVAGIGMVSAEPVLR